MNTRKVSKSELRAILSDENKCFSARVFGVYVSLDKQTFFDDVDTYEEMTGKESVFKIIANTYVVFLEDWIKKDR